MRLTRRGKVIFGLLFLIVWLLVSNAMLLAVGCSATAPC